MSQNDEDMRPTHTVRYGKLVYNAYLDGNVARDISTGRVLANQNKEGKWNKPVKEIKYRDNAFDHVKSLGNEPVSVVLSKGQYY